MHRYKLSVQRGIDYILNQLGCHYIETSVGMVDMKVAANGLYDVNHRIGTRLNADDMPEICTPVVVVCCFALHHSIDLAFKTAGVQAFSEGIPAKPMERSRSVSKPSNTSFAPSFPVMHNVSISTGSSFHIHRLVGRRRTYRQSHTQPSQVVPRVPPWPRDIEP